MSSVRMIGRRLAVLGLLAMTMTMAMAGCGGDDDDDGGTGPSNVAGTYTLRTVNNAALPATVYEVTGYKIEILAGNITLDANGSYTESGTIRETINGTAESPETIPGSGTWTRSGNQITLNDSDAEQEDTVVTVQSDGALTLSEDFGGTTITARFTK